ncbi:hypothetical protein M9H77_27937 [Catharanthus roseus]|uniref:Uncharacterized protein n=1 Tax=Catharanthus roseus TaxID=4058 RepID=A0ACC0AG49_CATRO|nr:hypothetical protein M9H77_27937 [Catharanthus roseus]
MDTSRGRSVQSSTSTTNNQNIEPVVDTCPAYILRSCHPIRRFRCSHRVFVPASLYRSVVLVELREVLVDCPIVRHVEDVLLPFLIRGGLGQADLGREGETGKVFGGCGHGDLGSYVPGDPFDSPELDFSTFSLGLTPLCSHIQVDRTDHTRPSLGIVGYSFQASSPPKGTVSSSFQAFPLLGAADEHNDEQKDYMTPAQQLWFGHHVGFISRLQEKRVVLISLDWLKNGNETHYLWTIRPNIAKEGIHILVEFIPIQPQTISISHDTNTINIPEHVTIITQMVSNEPSMLYPTVDEDDDENDHSNGDYAVSGSSKQATKCVFKIYFKINTVPCCRRSRDICLKHHPRSASIISNGLENGSRTDTYVPEIYSRQTYKRTYQANFHPVLSENFWRDVPFNSTFYLPNMKKKRGRKQDKRF